MIGGNHIQAGIPFHSFVPSVNTRAEVVIDCVTKNDGVLDAFLQKDAVATIAGGRVEECGAILGVRVEVNSVMVISGAIVGKESLQT